MPPNELEQVDASPVLLFGGDDVVLPRAWPFSKGQPPIPWKQASQLQRGVGAAMKHKNVEAHLLWLPSLFSSNAASF